MAYFSLFCHSLDIIPIVMRNQHIYLDIYNMSVGLIEIEEEWKVSHSGLPLVLHVSSRFSPSLVSPWGNPTTIFTSGLSAEKKDINLQAAVRPILIWFPFPAENGPAGFDLPLNTRFQVLLWLPCWIPNKRSDECNSGCWQYACLGWNNTP